MRLTEQAHQILTAHLQEGDLAIDATAGNGHDTQFLAEKVGTSGQVIAIDIQASAIEASRERLCTAALIERSTLICGDHATELECLLPKHRQQIAAITFNLGYLPGSDKSIQTQSESTGQALKAAHALLSPHGLLCVTAYRGHPGGAEEAQLVETWMRTQESAGHAVECFIPNSKNHPPILWVLSQKA